MFNENTPSTRDESSNRLLPKITSYLLIFYYSKKKVDDGTSNYEHNVWQPNLLKLFTGVQ